jgi:hypothetical protein
LPSFSDIPASLIPSSMPSGFHHLRLHSINGFQWMILAFLPILAQEAHLHRLQPNSFFSSGNLPEARSSICISLQICVPGQTMDIDVAAKILGSRPVLTP